MGVDDLVSTESAVVAAATAAVFSPKTRDTMRRGAVLGVAGVLKVGDVVAGAARGVVRGVKGDEHTPGTDGAAAPTGAAASTGAAAPSTPPAGVTSAPATADPDTPASGARGSKGRRTASGSGSRSAGRPGTGTPAA